MNNTAKITMTMATAGLVLMAGNNTEADAAKINSVDKIRSYDEMKRQEAGLSKSSGSFNLGGTQLKGVNYVGDVSYEDAKLWEQAIKELMVDISSKTNLNMNLFNDVDFTISPYKFQGISGLTHTVKNKHNVILSRNMSGIPSPQFKKEIMKEVISHELGHVIYNQVNVEDMYRTMIDNNNSNSSSTTNQQVSVGHTNWADSVEENFAEDMKVYIMESISQKVVTPATQHNPAQKKPQNVTNYSASRDQMTSLIQDNKINRVPARAPVTKGAPPVMTNRQAPMPTPSVQRPSAPSTSNVQRPSASSSGNGISNETRSRINRRHSGPPTMTERKAPAPLPEVIAPQPSKQIEVQNKNRNIIN